MNIFERFSRVAKANVNELLNKMEDPEKVMNQAVEDLQKDLVKIRQSYAEVMATQKRMEKQRAAAEQLANEHNDIEVQKLETCELSEGDSVEAQTNS